MLLLVGVVGAFGSINEFELMETNGVIMPTIAVSASEADSVMPLSQMQSALKNDAQARQIISPAPCLTDCGHLLCICSTQAHATLSRNHLIDGNPAHGGAADRLIFPHSLPSGIEMLY